jgi:hypothetical protein
MPNLPMSIGAQNRDYDPEAGLTRFHRQKKHGKALLKPKQEPFETLYMNRQGGRVQMYYETTENIWDEDTF